MTKLEYLHDDTEVSILTKWSSIQLKYEFIMKSVYDVFGQAYVILWVGYVETSSGDPSY